MAGEQRINKLAKKTKKGDIKEEGEKPGLLTGKVRALWLMDMVVIGQDLQNSKN